MTVLSPENFPPAEGASICPEGWNTRWHPSARLEPACAKGGMARFMLSLVLRTGGRFPWATLAVNVVGSLAFGIFAGWLAKAGSGEWVRSARLFAIVGICGGFTTFSTFSNETFELIRSGHGLLAAAYALVSLAGGLTAVSLGYWISR